MPQFTPDAARPVTQQPGDQPAAFAASFASGGHVVVWNSTPGTDPSTWGAFAQVYDAQGHRAGGPIPLFTQVSAMGQIGVVAGGVATLDEGTFVVSARAQRMAGDSPYPWDWVFWTERVSTQGQVLGEPRQVGPALFVYDYPTVSAGPVYAMPDGSSYVVQTNANTRYTPLTTAIVNLQRYSMDGTAVGQPVTASALGFLPDAAVLAGGQVLTAKADGRYAQSLYVTASDANGNRIGESTLTATPFGSTNHQSPEVAALANGNGVVLWRYSESAGASWTASWVVQLVDPAGQLVGARHTLAIDASTAVKLTSLESGGVIAWWGSGAGFQALFIDEGGRPAGTAFAIGTNVVSVNATADGGFVVESVQQDGATGKDVYEQKFKPVVAADEIVVNGGITWVPAGNHKIVGSAGLDQLAFANAHTQYNVTLDGISSRDGSITLHGIERLRFSDGYAVALDIEGAAGQAYRLYQAAFDRVPDLPGLGYQMNDLDTWLTLPQVASNFIASPEFQRLYGNVNNEAFVTLLYRNVLEREPEPAGLQYHLDRLATGATRADILVGFSESPENKANVIGQIDDGILYVPVM